MSGLCSEHPYYEHECGRCQSGKPQWVVDLEAEVERLGNLAWADARARDLMQRDIERLEAENARLRDAIPLLEHIHKMLPLSWAAGRQLRQLLDTLIAEADQQGGPK